MRNANAAATWAEAQDTFSPINNCLRAVMVAYGVLGKIPELARADATATEAWDFAADRHPGDRTPPRGALVCFPNWGRGKSGHIAIGLGGDRIRSTGIDSYAYFTGTIAEVAAACRNPYAGWVGDFAGQPISFTSTAGGNSIPIVEEEETTMATEMLWYVSAASSDGTVPKDSMYYQRTPGDALVQLAANWTDSSEYTQLRQKLSDGTSTKDLYTLIGGEQVRALIGKYGLVKSYASSAAPSTSGGAPTDNAALIKELQANTAATKALPAEIAKALLDLEAKRLAS